MSSIASHFRVVPRTPWVRPWALLGPVLILFLCLPLLRPLNNPGAVPVDETRLLAMVRQNLTGNVYVADTPALSVESLTEPSPTFALLLTPPAWLMQKMGFHFQANSTLMAYMLIAVGVTLPVALAAGLIYRMARLYELARPQRAAMGVMCVTGSGMISYATTLNPHALAAALVLASATFMLQALRSRRAALGVTWALIAGFSAWLAATLDPSALPIALLLPIVFLAWNVKWKYRLAAVTLFLIGSVIPVWLHRTLHSRPVPGPLSELAAQPPLVRLNLLSGEFEPSAAQWLIYHSARLVNAVGGAHGLFSHFPLLLIGAIGVMTLMHRHWPEAVKWLAAATLLAAMISIAAVVLSRIPFAQAGFATRWFIAFSPLLLFWAGAYLRQPHTRVTRLVAGSAVMFSIAVGLLGAARPAPPQGYVNYTAAAAMNDLIYSPVEAPLSQ